MIGGIDHETIVAERVQDRGGLRRRFGRQFADRLLALGKLVVEKFGQRVVERVSARGGGEQEAGEEREHAQREESARLRAPLRYRRRGRCRAFGRMPPFDRLWLRMRGWATSVASSRLA